MSAIADAARHLLREQGVREDQIEAMTQLYDWFTHAVDYIATAATAHALKGDLAPELLIVAKYNAGSEGLHHWSHFRNVHGTQDEYLAFLEEIRENVDLWDQDPTHVTHDPIDLGREASR